WVCDGDDYSKPVSVHFYMNGPAGSGTFIGSTEANTVRESAVAAQCGGNANHGFYFPTPSYLKDGLSHLIYAHAINIGVSPVNPLLSGVHSVLCSSGNETCKSPAGLVSWWTAEGSGKDVISANTGVLRNGVGFVQGKVGKAFSLDGVDDYVEVPDAANLDVTRSVTLSAWVNPSSLSCIGGWCAVLAKSGGSTRNYGLWVKGDGALVVSYKSQEYVRASSAINTIPINKWSHVVGVISPSPVGGPPVGALRLYVNGNPVAVSETLGNPNSPLIQDNNPLLIGASDLPAGYYFKGLIDEVQLYSRALAPQEVKKAYEVSSNGNCRA
ncbi:MAG TPA: LamG domain-containing protein, partial [Candidatus Nanoarchaeia archaeon]|nr:LamG domain-containing protein [Candidatus Nanoarchaeia archaeon]